MALTTDLDLFMSGRTYLLRRSRGLCVQCGEPSSRVRCAECAAANNKRQQNLKAERIAHGICFRCGKNKTAAQQCESCYLKHSERAVKWRINNPKYKRATHNKSSKNLVWWLTDNDYPEGFQILCWNCNMGKARNGGICPHKSQSKWLYGETPVVNCKKYYNRKYDREVFQTATEQYGGSYCKCCGEDNVFFLSLDHINNDGAEQRRSISKTGKNLAWWLQKRNWPSGFQILCFNCNCGRARNNTICPHTI